MPITDRLASQASACMRRGGTNSLTPRHVPLRGDPRRPHHGCAGMQEVPIGGHFLSLAGAGATAGATGVPPHKSRAGSSASRRASNERADSASIHARPLPRRSRQACRLRCEIFALAGLPLSKTSGTIASTPRKPLSRTCRRAMPSAIADAGELRPAPIRRPPPWRASQSLVDGASHRRAARQIGKLHAMSTAAAIRCVTATPPSSSMCRGRVLRLRHPGERWRGSPRPAAVDAQGQPLTAAGAACGRYLPERLRAGRDWP